jgi:hypothetical protein
MIRFFSRLVARRPRGDDGATLILALVIITVVAVVITALLPQATTSVAADIGLRDVAAADYNADGAAQVAINALRNSTFNNDVTSTTYPDCFGATPTSDTLVLPNFYPATNGLNGPAPSSAAVTCTAETGTGALGAGVPVTTSNRPSEAVLTLGTNDLFGQTYAQLLETVDIRGGIASKSNITAGLGSVSVTGGPIQTASGCLGLFTPGCTTVKSSAITDPNYPAPTTTPTPAAAPTGCNNSSKVADFSPGLYTSSATFNNCQASWIHLKPGVYYLNFSTSSPTWTMDSQEVVGGTLTATETNTPPAVPGACVSPLTSAGASGVELVLGGSSQLSFNGSHAEFCASYSATNVPVVVYGLKTQVGSGSNAVPKENGCTTLTTIQLFPFLLPCTAVSSPLLTDAAMYFQGMVYMPAAGINVSISDNKHATFGYGVVARTFSLTPVDILCTTCIRASIPDFSPGIGTATTVVDLNVYICPATPTCSASGTLALTARVSIFDPSSDGLPRAGARQIAVLSWSEQR